MEPFAVRVVTGSGWTVEAHGEVAIVQQTQPEPLAAVAVVDQDTGRLGYSLARLPSGARNR
jgi:hypothetical protein